MKKTIVALGGIGLLFPLVVFAAPFNTDLHYGSNGEDVKALQEFLIQQNVYSGSVSGHFYALTLAAVKKFQIAEGIVPASGYVGSLTRSTINQIIANQTSDSEGNATAVHPPVDLSQPKVLQIIPPTPPVLISTTTSPKKISYSVLSNTSLSLHTTFPVDIHQIQLVITLSNSGTTTQSYEPPKITQVLAPNISLVTASM
ncbi:MAG: peptidoglycan-binding protein, partial [Patescibacteria group bacterium]|nr:peptidoglycan-binding protein [Patescibacteria group bacterium]